MTPAERQGSTAPSAQELAVPPRLLAQLRGSTSSRVLLIESASGYEAETLVRQALRSGGTEVAWVTANEFDAESGRLWRRAASVLGASMPSAASTIEVLDAICSARAEGSVDERWLVVERLDLALPDVALGEIAYLATNASPLTHLVLTSGRSLPGLVHRLGADDLTRWTETQLEWTEAEVLEGLQDVLDPDGPRDSLSELVQLIGGWPAAVRALQGRPSASAHDHLLWLRNDGAEQLLDGWWRSLDPGQQEALRQTQVLDVLCDSLCAEVTEGPELSSVLSALVDDHGYLRPVSTQEYVAFVERMPLLTAFLRRRPEPQEVARGRHRRAATWFAQHYDSTRQIRHLIAAEETDEALELIHALESAMFEAGRADEVLAWYALLPADGSVGQEDALLRRAWALLSLGDPAAARPLHARLAGLLRAPAAGAAPRIRAEEALLAAALAGAAGDAKALLDQSTRAIELFGDDWSGNGPQYAMLLRARGLLWGGRLDDARDLLDEVTPRLDSSEFMTGLVAEQLAGAVALAQGHVREAFARGEAAAAFATRQSLAGRSMEAATGLLVRGSARVELGDVDGGERDLLGARQTAVTLGNVGQAVFASLGLARIELARRSPPAALAWVAQAGQLLSRETPHSSLRHHIAATEAQVRLMIGDTLRAQRVIDSLPPGPDATLLAIRLGQQRRPGSGLGRLYEVPVTCPRGSVSRQVLVAEALMPVSRRQVEGVLVDLAEVAHSEGMLMALLGASEDLLAVGSEIAVRRGHDGLLEMVKNATLRTPSGQGAPQIVLSRGEVQLLALLPGRESNQELADRLSVSVNTVKTRLRRLYGKLGVNRRDDAIREARARGLLR